MKNNNSFEEIYMLYEKAINSLDSNKNPTDEQLIDIIRLLSFDKVFNIYKKDNYNFDEISKLFEFYTTQLRTSFKDDKSMFYLKFKSYLLIVDLFTKLCLNFSTDKEKRSLINNILQTLRESKNMLKLYIPFEESEIKILNNLIGQQLYYYTHITYTKAKNKDIDYLFEEYYINLEKMLHGYELSHESDFGNCTNSNEEIEKMIFINNTSFLLLGMIHKINYYPFEKKYDKNPYFLRIVQLFMDLSKLDKKIEIKSVLRFEEILIDEFKNSAIYLKNHKNTDFFDEKIDLLRVDTDEYKQLIDIIVNSKV